MAKHRQDNSTQGMRSQKIRPTQNKIEDEKKVRKKVMKCHSEDEPIGTCTSTFGIEIERDWVCRERRKQ